MRLSFQAAIAAAAMPVVGFITGKVVGEASERAPFLAWTGVVVYAIALAASYAHLRHYYARFDAHGVKAAPFIAFAVEAATFYLSFASVVLESAWALWGSLVGAGVVFWGNLTSMSMGLVQTTQGGDRHSMGERVGWGPSSTAREAKEVEREAAPPAEEAPEEADLRRILEALSRPMGPSALSRETGLPKSTVARKLRRLVEMGLVEVHDGTYRRRQGVAA